ncbi:hypothetical protein Tco_1144202 [Tanacetum coccineum]
MVPVREGKCNESFPTWRLPALSQTWGPMVPSCTVVFYKAGWNGYKLTKRKDNSLGGQYAELGNSRVTCNQRGEPLTFLCHSWFERSSTNAWTRKIFTNPFYLKKAQQLEPKLYVGDIIEKTNPIVIPDSEETLMLAEESRSKMLLKQKDPIMLEKKVNTTPVDYARLNQLSQDFNSMISTEPTLSRRPTIVDVPKELPKVSMVNTSLKNLKHHLAGFDVVVKERTTPTAIIEGSWGDNYVLNQSAPSFDQLFKLNELEAQSQEKDTVIKKLKERIKSLSEKQNEDMIKKDLEEIETINIELDHRVTKLIAENEHLK